MSVNLKVLCVVVFATAVFLWAETQPSRVSVQTLGLPTFPSAESSELMRGRAYHSAATPNTLVVYIFSDTDPEYRANLRYFLRVGTRADDDNDYVIILNQTPGRRESGNISAENVWQSLGQGLGQCPPNVHFINHENRCFDWGTFGWLLENYQGITDGYKHIVMMNSGVRGPFLPAYWPHSTSWTRIFTDRLSDSTKLIGSTISCEGSQPEGKPLRKNAHVQSYVVAMDQVGLRILKDEGTVLACYENIQQTMFYSELGASQAILSAGFNIDSLMLRYQGIDWRDSKYWDCNADESPYKELHNDGVSLDPLEVLFVKVKAHLLHFRDTSAMKAHKYDDWLPTLASNDAVRKNSLYETQKQAIVSVERNDFFDIPPEFLPQILASKSGQTATGLCFDIDYYKQMNPDIREVASPDELLRHFERYGRFEGRLYRLIACPALRT